MDAAKAGGRRDFIFMLHSCMQCEHCALMYKKTRQKRRIRKECEAPHGYSEELMIWSRYLVGCFLSHANSKVTPISTCLDKTYKSFTLMKEDVDKETRKCKK